MSTAHFCRVTGVRIAAPGVSIEVDPKNGQPLADPPQPEVAPSDQQAAELEKLRAELAEEKKISQELYGLGMKHAREHEAAIAQLKAEHEAAIAQLKAEHLAELDAATKPAAPEAPEAGQDEPPTAEAVPRPVRKGNR